MPETEEINAPSWRAFKFLALLLGTATAGLIVAMWVPSSTVKAISGQIVATAHLPEGKSATSATDEKGTQYFADEISKLAQEVETQSATFSAEKDELDYLTRIVVLMMTAVGLYTIILGVVSWKALDGQRKEFERASKGSLANLERLRDELELDFPMLGRIQRNFKSILANLRTECESLAPRDAPDNSFSSLEPARIQRILFYEGAVTTALLLNTKGHEKELAEIYQLLGVFYGSKFYSTTNGGDEFEKSKNPEHFYRAQFYFDRASDLDPDNYTLLMRAGNFSQYYDNKTVASISRSYFEKASGVGTQFQKPLVSIALIELEAFKNPLSARDALKRAHSRKHYDEGRESPQLGYLAYLECCALCLSAQRENGTERQSTLRSAAEKLADVAKTPSKDWIAIRGYFAEDRSKYFAILENEPQLAQGVAESIQTLESFVFDEIKSP
ncbi:MULTISPECIES: hypothetical protein [Acidobacteriaceae]|uniref:hypothetical protein n=1 Tax=Acidobacteriaceae TaxID=204434 RepID=UPI00131AA3D2|nr:MULTISPECIES: hypothetical protein [Acidobacteriaceae]MDW5265222.1 hypothetical protein [Edaphobacter sp.]